LNSLKSFIKYLRIVLLSLLIVWGAVSVIGIAAVIEGLTSERIFPQPPLKTSALRPVAHLNTNEEMYLELLKRALTRYGLEDSYRPLINPQGRLGKLVSQMIGHARFVQILPFDPRKREHGRDWPHNAETMIGLERLDNLQWCVTDVLHRNIPGDLIECGAWRGGACILMRSVLKVYGDKTRIVWVADSFEGLPKPDENSDPIDITLWEGGEMTASLDQVKRNFSKYGMLDDQVRFLKGWFIDTLPAAPIERLAVLRLDCDLYESIMQSLKYLYPKVSSGGYVIIDDYGALIPAKNAVDDFRRENGIHEEIVKIDWTGVYWMKGN